MGLHVGDAGGVLEVAGVGRAALQDLGVALAIRREAAVLDLVAEGVGCGDVAADVVRQEPAHVRRAAAAGDELGAEVVVLVVRLRANAGGRAVLAAQRPVTGVHRPVAGFVELPHGGVHVDAVPVRIVPVALLADLCV